MKSEESDDYINFTDFITLNLIGIRVPLPGDHTCISKSGIPVLNIP